MKNRVLGAEDAVFYKFTNASTAKVAGMVVLVGGVLGVLQTDAAIGDKVCAQIGGVFEVDKQSADAMTQGQIVGFDIANQRADSSMLGNLEVWEAPAVNATKVKVRFPSGALPLTKAHAVTAGQDTANAAVLDTGLGVNPTGPVMIQISAVTTGIRRLPAGNVTWSNGAVTIADANLAVNEIIHISVRP